MEHWYAVQTKARLEKVVVENLRRQLYQAFLPLMSTQKRRAGRWRSAVEPLFPGYVFVCLDLSRDNAAPIRSTRGAIGLVCFGGAPRPVPAALMDALIDVQASGADPVEFSKVFDKGDKVCLVDGPFTGLNAIVDASSGFERVAVLIEMLGRSNRVTVSPHQLIPAC